MLELRTNYQRWTPQEKVDNAIDVIKEVFQFPDDAKPKRYLENDIDLKEPNEYLIPSKSPFSTTMRRKGPRISVSFFKWSEFY